MSTWALIKWRIFDALCVGSVLLRHEQQQQQQQLKL